MLLLAEKRKRAVADKKGEVKKKTLFVLISWRNETDVDSFINAANVASQEPCWRDGASSFTAMNCAHQRSNVGNFF